MCPDVVCVLSRVIPGEGGAERQETHAEWLQRRAKLGKDYMKTDRGNSAADKWATYSASQLNRSRLARRIAHAQPARTFHRASI